MKELNKDASTHKTLDKKTVILVVLSALSKTIEFTANIFTITGATLFKLNQINYLFYCINIPILIFICFLIKREFSENKLKLRKWRYKYYYIVFSLLLLLQCSFSIIKNIVFPKNEVIILIAKFESPNNFPGGLSKEQFDVEGEIKNQFESIKELYESKSNADKIDIEFIDEEIKYEDEQKVFDELEKRLSGYKFGLIVWGKYKSTGNESRISARIGASESLLESKNLSASLNDNDKKSINVIKSKYTQFNSQVKGKYTDFAEYKLQEELAGKNLFLVLITLGFANVKSNNFEASEMLFDKAISLYKTGAKSLSIPYFGKGLIYQKQNKIDLSVKNYADSLSNYSKTNPKYDGFAATSYNNLAMICFLNPQKCTPKFFKNILGLDKNKYSYRTLARDREHKNSSPFSMFFIDNEETNLSDGVIDLSEIFLNKSLDIYNSLKISNSITLNNIGYLSLFKGNLENALKYFNKAIASDDKNFMAYSNRGVLRLFCYNQNDNLKDYQDAKNDFKKSINLSPKNWLAYQQLGQLELVKSNQDFSGLNDGHIYIEKSLEINKDNLLSKISKADFLDRSGYYEGARSIMDNLISKNKNNAYLYFNRGMLFFGNDQYENAYEDFQAATDLKIDYFEAYRYTHYALGKLGASEYKKHDAKTSKDYILRAVYSLMMGQRLDAKQYLINAMKVSPNIKFKKKLTNLRKYFDDSESKTLCPKD